MVPWLLLDSSANGGRAPSLWSTRSIGSPLAVLCWESNIFLIIDIHGKDSTAFTSRWAIDVGVGESYQSLTTEIGQCIPDIFSSIFLKYGFNSTYNSIHDGYGSQRTITTYVTDEIGTLDAMQLEINSKFRGCDGDEWEDYYNMIMALSEFINTMNYIYNSEILSQ